MCSNPDFESVIKNIAAKSCVENASKILSRVLPEKVVKWSSTIDKDVVVWSPGT